MTNNLTPDPHGIADAAPPQRYVSCRHLERSLVFAPGTVNACCANTHTGLTPVLAALAGAEADGRAALEAAKTARARAIESHKAGDIIPECQSCERLREYEWDTFRDIDQYSIDEVTITHFTTCNVRCNYCYTVIHEDKISAPISKSPQLLATFEHLIEAGELAPYATIRFSGGEPTLLPEFEALLTLLSEYGTKNVIYTNAVKRSQAIIDGVKRGNVDLILGIDAATPQVYQAIKKMDYNEIVWQNVAEYCRSEPAEGENKVWTKFIVTEENHHEAGLFVRRAAAAGARHVFYDVDASRIASRGARNGLMPEIIADKIGLIRYECMSRGIEAACMQVGLAWFTPEREARIDAAIEALRRDALGPELTPEPTGLFLEGRSLAPRLTPRRLLAGNILDAVTRFGQHPFMTVRAGPEERDVLICPAQAEQHSFADLLESTSPTLPPSSLCRSIVHVLRDEIYAAAFAIFDWATGGAAERGSMLVLDQDEELLKGNWCFPIYDLYRDAGHTTAVERAATLLAAFDRYATSPGNDDLRRRFLAVFAFALSRCCGAIGAYGTGLEILDRAQQAGCRYLHFEACRHALQLKQYGKTVPARLQKFAGYDNQALSDLICSQPFKVFDVNPNGTVYVCCAEVLPMSIGNMEDNENTDILNSPSAKNIRKSMLDGSFRYCDHISCPRLINHSLPLKDSDQVRSDPVLDKAVEYGCFEVDSIQNLSFGYDISCNLSCPSCRPAVHVAKAPAAEAMVRSVMQRIAPLLPSVERLYLNHCGEFLVSKASRQLLASIDPELCRQLKIDLISNGTLFSETEWDKFPNIHSLVATVHISTDAATRDTFERLRRGGKWDGFVENLRFLARLRAEGTIQSLTLAFVYQVDNFREMPDFVTFCEAIGADRADFERLLPSSAMTETEFRARAVHLTAHPLHGEFLELVNHPRLRQGNVSADIADWLTP